METVTQQEKIEQIKQKASAIMHFHYCENDVEHVIETFAPDITWFGAGEGQYAVGRQQTAESFRQFRGEIPKCNIWDEQYDVTEIADDLYMCTGAMWIATDPSVPMYLKVHQRLSFIFRWSAERITCVHIHCSNPYMEMLEDELFPDKIGQQSYAYVQETMHKLEEEMQQKNKQLEIIMNSVSGGLAICRDDEQYSYVYVSEEAARVFGYTVDEFMQVSGGAVAALIYPNDRERALCGRREGLKSNGQSYEQKYRVICKDGSLKWVLDSGRTYENENGEIVIHTLYLDITKSEQAAEEILQQKELLTSIFNTVPYGILRFRRTPSEYKLISINPAAISLLGYHDRDVFFREWKTGIADTVLEEDRHILVNSYAAIKNLGDNVDVEYRICWPDGSIHWLQGSNSIVAAAEEYQVIQRIFFDITKNRMLEEQLRREQEMYRLAMESSSDIMYEYVVAEDTLTTYEPRTTEGGANYVEKRSFPHYQQILAEGHIVHPKDAALVIKNICQGNAQPFECRLCLDASLAQDEYWWYGVTGKAIFRNNMICRVVGTFRNIHQGKMALRANMKELYMNQSALQAVNGSYLSIYYVNLPEDWVYGIRLPGMGNYAEYEQKDNVFAMLQQYIDEYVVSDDQEKMRAFISLDNLNRELQSRNDLTSIEYRDTRNGQKRWLQMDFYLVQKEQGVVQHVIMTFQNVTERRKKELELRQEEERARKALEEAYEAVRRASAAKSDFLSHMSHDIRTPMNAIVGMTAIAEKNIMNSEKLQDCLQKIKLSSAHLLSLINEVLDMSKIENGNLELNTVPFYLKKMLQDTAKMIQTEVDAKQQVFELRMDSLLHDAVEGDMVRVQQILLNLLSNAVKYTPRGGSIQLEVRELPQAKSGIGCYQFIVGDNGIGMTEAFQEKIFLPFERAEDSRVVEVQGTGLGLAITQNLVRMMNGMIEVSSRLNEGTQFIVTLYFPLVLEVESDLAAPTVPVSEKQNRNWRILLVEDNDLNREIAKELLEAEGILVEEAMNGAMAVDKFTQADVGYYDLILMDIQMPVMNGYVAARTIRALARPDGTKIPIIALTANAFVDDIYLSKQAGMNAHLAKPLNMEQIMATLHEWLPE